MMQQSSGSKKLVYVLNYVSGEDSQHFVHVFNLLSALQARGWSIAVLSEKGGVGVKTVLGHEVRYLSLSGGPIRILRLLRELTLLRRNGYGLVFVRISKPAALTAALARSYTKQKILYWLSGANYDFDQQQNLIRRSWTNFLMNKVVGSTDYFVTGPETMVCYSIEHFEVPKKKTMLLYNDIDLTRFSSSRRVIQPDKPLQILFVHSFSPIREATRYFPALMKMLSAVNKTKTTAFLRVIGKGPERTLLQTTVAEWGMTAFVEFVGAVANVEIQKHYAQSDIFIMPSYREGMPRVILEAMASGLPIVSTDAGGTKDLLGPQQLEYVVSRDEPDVFANKLQALIEDATIRAALSRENLLFVRKFSTETVADMYDEKLCQLL